MSKKKNPDPRKEQHRQLRRKKKPEVGRTSRGRFGQRGKNVALLYLKDVHGKRLISAEVLIKERRD